MSGQWCHWCMLSAIAWGNCDHEEGSAWTIQLIKDHLEKQLINNNMIPYEKRIYFTTVI